jgi:ubiquinone/menaquinone biosynthesis C-methylase UbiE
MNDYKYNGEELDVFGKALNWKSYWVEKIRPHIGNNVLEVGAGIGATTIALKHVSFDSWLCIEPDSLLCEKIRERKNNGEIDCKVVILNCIASELPVNNKFDTILYIDVLEHIKNDREELDTAYKLLNKNGKIIILSPAHNYLYSQFDSKIGHFRRYNKRQLCDIVPIGMAIKQIDYMDSIGFFASLANKLILKQSDPTAAQIALWDRFMIPISRIIDPILFYMAGKSIIVVLQKEEEK